MLTFHRTVEEHQYQRKWRSQVTCLVVSSKQMEKVVGCVQEVEVVVPATPAITGENRKMSSTVIEEGRAMAAWLGLSVSSRSSNKVRLRGGAEVLEPCDGSVATVRETEVGEKARRRQQDFAPADSCAPGARPRTHRGAGRIPRRGVGHARAGEQPRCSHLVAAPVAEGTSLPPWPRDRATALPRWGRVHPAMDGAWATVPGGGFAPLWLPRRRARRQDRPRAAALGHA